VKPFVDPAVYLGVESGPFGIAKALFEVGESREETLRRPFADIAGRPQRRRNVHLHQAGIAFASQLKSFTHGPALLSTPMP
jgi:hypothetical protein